MVTAVAFLRAVNLGQKRKFPAADIRRVLEAGGYRGVETRLASGNVLLGDLPIASDVDRRGIEAAVEAQFSADRGFEVPTIVFTADELRAVAADTLRLAEGRELARHYVYLLREPLDPATVAALADRAGSKGEMVASGRAVHALLAPGYADGVVDPLNATKLLPLNTNRNANVVRDLADRWC